LRIGCLPAGLAASGIARLQPVHHGIASEHT